MTVKITRDGLMWCLDEVRALEPKGLPAWELVTIGLPDAVRDYERGMLPALTVPAKYLPEHELNGGMASTASPVYLRIPDEYIIDQV